MVARLSKNQSSLQWISRAWNALQCFVVGSAGLILINSAYSSHDRILRALDSTVRVEAATDWSSAKSNANSGITTTLYFPLGVPEGEAEALPSVQIEMEEVARGIYGGKGDKKHLGGFTAYDGQGISPTVWKYMVQELGVKSIMDVGCGKGVSTLWFHLHGAKALCVEGSHDAVQNSLLPDPASQIVEHDFSRGPYWPAETYDAVWSVEFLEHVGRNYQYNYIQAFRKSALIFASHSHWGGWHHVEVHTNSWWETKFESLGFKYSRALTEKVRQLAIEERNHDRTLGPDGKPYNAQHIWLTMQVYINPVVASLQKHAHLFAEHGCFKGRQGADLIHKECGTLRGGETESTLPPSFRPLKLAPEQDELWLEQVKESINDLVDS